ncbi:MAG: GNAT family N-acetyltransferase [Bacteroidetes bacterium]|nr:GNAT family N-acetyltransferase [Bacteroidota bacterium]
MDHRIRQATLDDLAIIIGHRRRMFADSGLGDTEVLKAGEPLYAEWLRERLGNGLYQGWLMVAPSGMVVSGVGLWLVEWPTGVLNMDRYRGYVFNVYTEPEHRRQGLARRLMQALLDASAAQGIHVVSLHASAEGRAVYETLGFAATNEMRILL